MSKYAIALCVLCLTATVGMSAEPPHIPERPQKPGDLTREGKRARVKSRKALERLRKRVVDAMECGTCRGKGTVANTKTVRLPGKSHRTYDTRKQCPQCHGALIDLSKRYDELLVRFYDAVAVHEDAYPFDAPMAKGFEDWVMRNVKTLAAVKAFNRNSLPHFQTHDDEVRRPLIFGMSIEEVQVRDDDKIVIGRFWPRVSQTPINIRLSKKQRRIKPGLNIFCIGFVEIDEEISDPRQRKIIAVSRYKLDR